MSDTILVIFEDQQHFVPTEIASDDDKLRALFAPYAPAAASAKIERDNGKVTMIKQSGPKGQHPQDSPLISLIHTPETINPAIVMAQKVQHLELSGGISIEEMEALSEAIETAIEQGTQAVKNYKATLETLKAVPGYPISSVPTGF